MRGNIGCAGRVTGDAIYVGDGGHGFSEEADGSSRIRVGLELRGHGWICMSKICDGPR